MRQVPLRSEPERTWNKSFAQRERRSLSATWTNSKKLRSAIGSRWPAKPLDSRRKSSATSSSLRSSSERSRTTKAFEFRGDTCGKSRSKPGGRGTGSSTATKVRPEAPCQLSALRSRFCRRWFRRFSSGCPRQQRIKSSKQAAQPNQDRGQFLHVHRPVQHSAAPLSSIVCLLGAAAARQDAGHIKVYNGPARESRAVAKRSSKLWRGGRLEAP
jgi:hypothetical protein